MAAGDPIIRVEELRKSYGNLRAVDGVSFEVHEGEIFGILGPNGAGKTTTLEIMEGLRRPDSGSIELDGLDAIAQTRQVKEIIGVQLQATALFDYLKVGETVELFASFYRRRVDVDDLLATIRLGGKRDAYVPALSGGQKQRLSIGLALVNEPRVVFLDEPTTGLDPQARHHLWDVVRDIRTRGTTLMLTTHYMEEADVLCDRLAIMDAGRIIALDTAPGLIGSLEDGSTIEIDAAGVPLDEVSRIGTIGRIGTVNGRVVLITHRPEDTVDELLKLSRTRRFDVQHLSVRGPTLEDVFLAYTGRSLRE